LHVVIQIPSERVFDLPISAEPWTIQGYTWAPKFSVLAERALQKAGFDRHRFNATLSSEVIGEGLSEESEVLLVWAGQQAADRKITLEAVRWRKERMGPQAWGLLVKWFAALYGSWIVARATARVEQHFSSLHREEERI
jgi:hypothetical protein